MKQPNKANEKVEEAIAIIMDKENHHVSDECNRKAWVNFTRNWMREAVESERTRLLKEVEKIKCECTCGCEFGDGCLCKGDREGFNDALDQVKQIINNKEDE